MAKGHEPDYILLAVVFILLAFGIIMVASASIVKGFLDFGDSYYYAKHQFLYGIVPGLVFLLAAQRLNYRGWIKLAVPLLLLSVGVLLLVFIPALGFSHGGAKRWLTISSLSFQPSEFVKIIFIIYLAVWFDKKGDKVKDRNETLLPFIFLVGFLSVIIIAQPNLGMLSIISLSSVALYYVAGGRIRHLAFLFLLWVASLAVFIRFEPYRLNRFMIYLYPEMDPLGKGYQINQAMLAIGSGGIFGMGLGWSGQKYNYLPEPFGDSIFAIIGEELGFIGILALLILFMLFLWRCFSIAKAAPDKFSRLLVVGITAVLAFQFFMNIAAITRLMPLTGVPLPFISYGGSAMMSALLGVGIILNVSRHTLSRRPRY